MHKSPSPEVGARSNWPPEKESISVGFESSVGQVKIVALLENLMGDADDRANGEGFPRKKRPSMRGVNGACPFILLIFKSQTSHSFS